MAERKTASWPIVAALLVAVVLVPLALYVGGYFALSSKVEFAPNVYVRYFKPRWGATIYAPAAEIESHVTGGKVEARRLIVQPPECS